MTRRELFIKLPNGAFVSPAFVSCVEKVRENIVVLLQGNNYTFFPHEDRWTAEAVVNLLTGASEVPNDPT